MIHQIHLKLIASDAASEFAPFADYYRFGDVAADYPLVIYVGGGITADEYRRRLQTEPLPVLHAFAAALAGTGLEAIDLLILPFPPEPNATVYQQLFSALILELLKQTPNSRPQKIACVGNSIGASFASYLTFSLAQVKALATLGGYGMVEGANESNMVGEVTDRIYRCWWNADSPGYMENLFFLQFLTKRNAEMEIETAPGGHDFADYAANGSVTAAFKLVMSVF